MGRWGSFLVVLAFKREQACPKTFPDGLRRSLHWRILVPDKGP